MRRRTVGVAGAALALLGAGLAAWLLSGGTGPSGPRGEDGARAAGPGPGEAGPAAAAPEAGPAEAPAAPAAGTTTVSGRLVRGSPPVPVPGEVSLAGKGVPPAAAKAGPDGRFLLRGVPRHAWFDLLAASPGLLPARLPDLRVPGPIDVGDVLLGPGERLEVLVRDRGDRPVAGARVALVRGREHPGQDDWLRRLLDPPPRPAPAPGAATGEDGRVLLEGVAPGDWTVTAEAKGFALGTASASVREGLRRDAVRVLLSPARELRGVVYGEDGKPLPGAVVSATPGLGGYWGDSPARVETATDAAGAYRLQGLREGTHSLAVVRRPRSLHGAGAVEIPAVREFDIRLGGPATVKGKVADDATGAPVAGARVSVQVWGEGAGGAALGSTAADGTFALEGLPPGNFGGVEVEAAGYLPWPDAKSPTREQAQLAGGAAVEVEVRLRRGAAVLGTVKDGAGKPVAGARVWVDSYHENWGVRSRGPGISGADGSYRVEEVDRGVHLARVEAEGLHQPDYPADVWDAFQGGALPEAWLVKVEDAPEVRKDLVLSGGGTVAGTVVDPEGRPAAGIAVSAAAEGKPGGGETVATDGEGRFRIRGIPPSEAVTVAAAGPKGLHATQGPLRLEAGGSVEDLRIALAAGASIAGRVRRVDGASSQGASLRVLPGELNPRQPWEWGWRRRMAESHPVGADGAFRIEGLAAGKHTLLASAEGAGEVTGPVVELAEGEAKEGVEVVLGAERPISGKVSSEKGEPVGGAEVSLKAILSEEHRNYYWSGDRTVAAVTAADGSFTLRGTGEGKYEVTAAAPGFVASRAEAAGGDGAVALVLRAGGAIGGTVVDRETGAPVEGLPVSAQPLVHEGPWTWKQATTGKDGSFLLEGLPPGAFRVTAGSPWGESKSDYANGVADNVKAGTRDVRILVSRGLAISGRLQEEDGKAVAVRLGIQAMGTKEDGEYDWERQRTVTAEADGTFRISGLLPGNYVLNVDPSNTGGPGGGYAPATVKGIPSGAEGVVVTLKRGVPISGKVVDDRGAPWKEEGWLGVSPAGQQEEDSPFSSSTSIGGDGTFTTGALDTAKTYDLVFDPQEAGWLGASAKGVAPGTKDVVLRMTRGRSLAGRVLDEAGAPVGAGVPVNAQATEQEGNEPGRYAQGETKADGTFLLEGLGDGSYRVFAGGGNTDWSQAQAGPVEPGGAPVEVRVKRGVTLSGRLVDAAGKSRPVPWIMGEQEGGAGNWVQPGSDGAFTLKGLAAGKVKLKAWVGGNEPVDLGTYEAPGSGLTVTVP